MFPQRFFNTMKDFFTWTESDCKELLRHYGLLEEPDMKSQIKEYLGIPTRGIELFSPFEPFVSL
jgi:hypothetical protein